MYINVQDLVHETFDQLAAILNDCKEHHIHFDLGAVRQLDSYGLLGIVLAIRRCSERGHLVTLAPPQNKEIFDFVVKAQLFQAISEFTVLPLLVVSPASSRDDTILPILKVDPRQGFPEMLRLINLVSNSLKVMLYGENAYPPKTVDKFITNVTELCGNVQHSQDFGYVTANRFANRSDQLVTVTVADLGVGITPPLEEKYPHKINKWADHKAIKLAMQSDISSRPHGGGIGLTELGVFVAQTEGISLVIRSGTGKLVMSPQGKLWSKSLPYFPGTQISLSMRRRQEG